MSDQRTEKAMTPDAVAEGRRLLTGYRDAVAKLHGFKEGRSEDEADRVDYYRKEAAIYFHEHGDALLSSVAAITSARSLLGEAADAIEGLLGQAAMDDDVFHPRCTALAARCRRASEGETENA